MNICLYSPSWPPESSPNGVVTYVGQLAPALRGLGHRVVILTPKNDSPGDPHVVELSHYKSPQSFMLRAMHRIAPEATHFREFTALLARAVQDLIRTQQIEIFEIEEFSGWSSAISALQIIPVVVRLHGPWFLTNGFDNGTRERREGNGIRDADFVTAPSQWVLDKTRSVCQFSATRSASIPNMQDVVPSTDRWRLADCDRESILFVGRFDEIKGGDLVIRAFGELAKRNPNLRLTFVGPDNQIGGMQIFDYAKSVLSEDINRRLTYLGPLTKTEIARLRPKHFMTVSASRFEVFPYAILEAMSFGCPIVAPSVGGIPELFASSERHRLFEAGNIDALVEACESLLDSPELAEHCGDSAFKTCATLFSSRKNATRTEQCYQHVVERFRYASTVRAKD
jgi:glycosyltransferase involved in cell wall biosynthesis